MMKQKKRRENRSIKKIFERYITEDLHDVILMFDRQIILCIILEIIQIVQIFALQLNTDNRDKIVRDSSKQARTLLDVLLASLILPILELFDIKKVTIYKNFVIAQFAIIASFLFVALVQIMFKLLNYQISETLRKILGMFTSSVVLIYSKLLQIPFYYCIFYIFFNSNELNMGNSHAIVLAVCSLLMNIILTIISTLFDFDYRLYLNDNFARRDQPVTYTILFLSDLILVILHFSELNSGLQIIHFLIACLKFTFYLKDQMYYNSTISCIQNQGYLIYIVYTIIIYISTSASTVSSINPIYMLIVLTPFIIKTASELRNMRINAHLFIKHKKLTFFSQQDLYIRTISDYYIKGPSKSEFSDQIRNLLYTSLMTKHLNKCNNIYCNCRDFQILGSIQQGNSSRQGLQQQQQQQLLQLKQNNHQADSGTKAKTDQRNDGSQQVEWFDQYDFLKLHISQKLQQYLRMQNLQRNGNNKMQVATQINYLHLSFCIEIEKIITKSYLELYKIKKNEEYLNIKERYILSQLSKRLEKQFDGYFNSSIYQNQRLQIKKVADFDEQKRNLDVLQRDSLILLRDFYIFLSQDNIISEELIDKNEQLIKQKKAIHSAIQQQIDICPQNSGLHRQAQIYLNFFEGRGNTLKTLVQQSQNIMSKKLLKIDTGINLFASDSCVVFISLMKPIGMMKSISDSTESMFQYKIKDLTNKSCNMLMPLAIAQVHDKILQKFIDYGSMINIASEQVKVFGLNRQGFIFPLMKRISICYTEQDFGVAAHLAKENLTFQYILIDKSNTVIGINEQLFTQYFSSVVKDPKELIQLSIGQMIPVMMIHTKRNEIVENIQTCIIIPNTAQNFDTLKIIQEPLEQNLPKFFAQFSFNNYSIFEIQGSFCSINLDLKNEYLFRYLQIIDIRKLRKKQEKIEVINQLKMQLNQEFHLNLPIQITDIQQNKSNDQNLNNNQQEKDKKINQNENNQENQDDNNIKNNSGRGDPEQNELDTQQLQQARQQQEGDMNLINLSLNSDLYKVEQDEEKVPMPIQESARNKNSVFQQLKSNDNIDIQEQIQFNQLITPRSVMSDYKISFSGEQNNQTINRRNNENSSLPQQKLAQGNQMIISNYDNQNMSGLFSNFPDQLISPRSDAPIINSQQEIIQKKNKDYEIQQQPQQSIVGGTQSNLNNILVNQNPEVQKKQSTLEISNLDHARQIQQSQQCNIKSNFSSLVDQEQQQQQIDLNRQISDHPSSQEVQENQLDVLSKNIASNLSWSQDNKNIGIDRKNFLQQSEVDSQNKQGVSIDNSKKMEIIESIHNNEKQKVINSINLAGWFAFIILIISNTVVYIQLNTSFYYAIQTFQIMAVTPEIKDKYSVLIYHKEFIRFVDEFNPIIISDPSQTSKSFITQQNKFVVAFRKRIKDWILKQVYDVTGQFNQFNRENYIKLELLIDDHVIQQTYTINYAEIILLFYANRYSFKNENSEVTDFINKNYRTYVNSFFEAVKFNKNNAYNTVDNIKNVVIITLVIIEMVGFLIVLILFPIYNLIQLRREKILRLFGTFSQDKLNKYINIIESAIQTEISDGKSYLRKMKYSQKKKTISISTGLKKYSWIIMIISVLSLTMLSLYPIINLVITYNFLDQYTMSSEEMLTFFVAKTHTIENYAANNYMIYQQLKGNYLSNSQLDHLQQLSKDHTSILNSIITLEKNIDANVRQNGAEYIDFIKQSLHGDVCHLIWVKNANLNVTVIDANETVYYINKCPFFWGGIITKGVLRMFSGMYDRFDGLLQLYLKNKTGTEFFQILQQFDQGDSLYDLHQTYKYIQVLFEVVRTKLINLTDIQYQTVRTSQDILFAISVSILVFMFCIGWTKFLNYMNFILNRTKLMLGNINIEYILENTYMLHYIHEELIMRKQ